MAFFNWFKREKTGHTLTDEDREASKELRAKKKEIDMMKLEREDLINKMKFEKQKLELQEEIDELKGLFDEEDETLPKNEDDTTTALLKMFAPALISKFAQQTQNTPAYSSPSPQQIPPTTPLNSKVSISDEELLKLWEETPTAAKLYSKSMSDETIITTLKAKFPNVDDESINRGLKIIRS